MNTNIDQLNRRLAEGLGAIGGQARFAWQFAPEVFYFYRHETAATFERMCWADRIGKVWMLCQWREPVWIDHMGNAQKITPEGWFAAFKGEFPYPERGAYSAHPETARMDGSPPTEEGTAFYIATIREQMAKDYDAHLRETEARLHYLREENKREFFESAENDFPAFWSGGQGHTPGTRGGHVSFGGV